ncbi:MAG TPA: hydrogenase iron-sulfur subunit [Thermodesulfobacteriota bacterium]|nr:hydrogenase iron-sulfur subunit [Thermodesulfobacteriota bacterium]
MESREFEKPGPLTVLWLWVEKLVNGFTTSEYNPFYYLGAVSIFFLWVILVSGIYLFLFYEITARGAYASVEYLTVNQWYLGGVMRSLHRYASDGLVITMLLHAARCFALDRYKHWRWIAWVSGVVMAWIIWIGGIFGYWMVWDEKAKLVASLSARLIESLPIFGLPLSLNFVRLDNLTDQLFYIVLFIHFSSIFFLFILILIHIMRVTKSVINPPKTVAWGLVIMLLVVSFIKPATSAPPADLKGLTQTVPFDWFYMAIFPFLKAASPRMLWAFIVALTLIGGAVPWLTRTRRRPAAALTLENCTGCELCMEDCPYQAIQMRKRTDGMPYHLEAVIMDKRCASCGICVGACDYKALNLPDITEDDLKSSIRRLAGELKDSTQDKRVMVFVCAKGALPVNALDGKGGLRGFEWARVVAVPCIGMVQPSMLSIPFEKGLAIDGVYVAGCRHGDCDYRRGDEWFAGRLAGVRPPVVKKSLERDRVRFAALSAVEQDKLLSDLKDFHASLKGRSTEK